MSNVASAGKSSAIEHHDDALPRLIQAILSGTGAISAAVAIEGSLSDNPPAWCSVGTISLSGTDAVSNFIVSANPWMFTKATLTAISGTNATISVNIST